MTIGRLGTCTLVATLLVTLAGCASAPRQTPLPLGDVSTGPGSLEYVRRQLQGTWDIVTYEWYGADNTLITQDAEGTLSLDEFGNLSVRGRIMGLAGDPDQDVDYTGRIVVDTVRESFRLQNIVDRVPLDLPEAFDPELSRFYALDGDTLRLSVRDADGRETAATTWKKRG